MILSKPVGDTFREKMITIPLRRNDDSSYWELHLHRHLLLNRLGEPASLLRNITPRKLRGGDLPLPPGTTTLSSTSGLSIILSVSTTSSTEDGIDIRQVPRPPVTSRARSGSLSIYSSAKYSRIRLAELQPAAHDTLTLLVVGTAKCGKSVVVKKGLKGYGLSEPINHSFQLLLSGFQL
ncbi:Ras guanyl-nucleotide exchange factor [Mycena indigotica]|uniref:Ras guanyl-nucleotide exchange factor n=1 Tax=Mycena indigotica TaxID=2126181 RepID=A0A8H6S7F5_9AGAR|nr:Ras guanyl-nucleotide exchange factor [Mycena indigotica]KAF7293693.1 Ras guanyl-nucleotide exchange factor [Mycena indigotica]